MTTPFDQHAQELIGSTKNSHVIIEKYERCSERGKELDQVVVHFNIFTLTEKGFKELGVRSSPGDIFATNSERSESEPELTSLFLNPVYSFSDLNIQSLDEVKRLIYNFNFAQLEKASSANDFWNEKHKVIPHSEEISNIVMFNQRVIGRYEMWFAENNRPFDPLELQDQILPRNPKRGELKKIVSKYALERGLKKGETVQSKIIHTINHQIEKEDHIKTIPDAVRSTLSKLGYSDPYKSKQ